MVRSAVHDAFLNTLTVRTAFPRVPLEMTLDDNIPGADTENNEGDMIMSNDQHKIPNSPKSN